MSALHAPFAVLFLCTGNSARSILCEATLRHHGGTRFEAHSAGSSPAGKVNPLALAQLRAAGIAIDGLASKSWDVYASAPAPKFGLVVTVCDSAAAETCPVFFGDFARVHWGLPDPSHVEGDDAVRAAAFAHTHAIVARRIEALVALPVETLDASQLALAIDAIADRFPADVAEHS